MVERFAVTRPGAPAREAARALLTLKVGCLPVIDGGELVGIVTDTDFVRVAYAVLAAATPRARKPVRKQAKRRARAR
jgi:CBS domain-containing protein